MTDTEKAAHQAIFVMREAAETMEAVRDRLDRSGSDALYIECIALKAAANILEASLETKGNSCDTQQTKK